MHAPEGPGVDPWLGPLHREAIRQALAEVIDPELGVNIVDLGLIYGIEVRPGGKVQVRMTMTTPVCPLGAHLVAETEAAVHRAVPDARAVDVKLVWDPPWNPGRMSAAARRQLGWRE